MLNLFTSGHALLRVAGIPVEDSFLQNTQELPGQLAEDILAQYPCMTALPVKNWMKDQRSRIFTIELLQPDISITVLQIPKVLFSVLWETSYELLICGNRIHADSANRPSYYLQIENAVYEFTATTKDNLSRYETLFQQMNLPASAPLFFFRE